MGCLALLLITGCAPDRGGLVEPSDTATSDTLPVPEQTSGASASSTPSATGSGATSSSGGFDMDALSIDDPASLWVVVNKTRPLSPNDYAAPDLVSVPVAHVYAPMLRQEASDAVVDMFAAFASETGLAMQSQSAYRSYSAQVTTYNGWVASKGKAGADLTSARPGYSEHQTGLAIDISAKPAKCSLDQCFAETAQGKWLAANAYKYGFILRYPDGYTDVTGYEFEPWHYRYVGLDLAKQYHDTGATTLEQFFGLPDAPDYLN
jgi:D-alanyl-D-alanine carboxypeptidase